MGETMIEVLWHGRGGQGAFTAARLLGAASSLSEGHYALAFPSFGPERRGAPMRAFTKFSDAPIGDRSAIDKADYVVYLDDTLIKDDWDSELKPNGMMLVNSVLPFNDDRVIALDADGMSEEILGRPIPNTVILGALTALCDQVDPNDIKEAVRQYMPARLHENNIALVDAAMQKTEALMREKKETAAASGQAADTSVSGAASDTQPLPAFEPEPPRPADAIIPTLRDFMPEPEECARTTCYEAGFLREKNAGWRNIRPVIDRDSCTGCMQCFLLCPDGAIYPVDAPQAPADAPAARRKASTLTAVDYDFCKGCGVCVPACKFGSIKMIPEREALLREARARTATPASDNREEVHAS